MELHQVFQSELKHNDQVWSKTFYLSHQLLIWCEEQREKTEKHVNGEKKSCEKIIKPTAINAAVISEEGAYFHNDFRGIWLYLLHIIRWHIKGEYFFCILQRLRKFLI